MLRWREGDARRPPVTDPEDDVMRAIQGVLFNQPDQAMRESSLDHRSILHPTGPASRQRQSKREQGRKSIGHAKPLQLEVNFCGPFTAMQ
ncbi:hypothetical protein L798_09582 [Zootermopsis nevadensis]|uniref:Uncharacterized protein n=1 Tax=Zootermopsis nevadensis TaxID=136037 RepID=A0A067RBV9_ZOONE|nr:hypothetical protein L798_09582 [Zootermopsis nevadensis]